jgi:hypothetical protein
MTFSSRHVKSTGISRTTPTDAKSEDSISGGTGSGGSAG